MPNFNKDAASRGNAVVERGSSSGNYRPFLPQIYWKGADDEHFVLILNPIEDIMRLQFHPYVETDDGGRSIIARTDPAIGERTDPISDQWNYTPRTTDMMIAVELEPVYTVKTVNGRERQSVEGFEVLTKTIERRIRNEEGELTDEREEIDIPVVGYIAQSPFNFGNHLNSYENRENPIHVTPFKVTQVGAGSGKAYSFDGFPDAQFDLTNLFEYIENISYVQKPEEVLELIDELDQEEAGIAIGQYLLDLKLEELADLELYNEILGAITKPSKYGKETKEPARPKRSSQRSSRGATEGSGDAEASESKPARVARSRKASESTTQPSPEEKLAELRSRRESKEAEKAAA